MFCTKIVKSTITYEYKKETKYVKTSIYTFIDTHEYNHSKIHVNYIFNTREIENNRSYKSNCVYQNVESIQNHQNI